MFSSKRHFISEVPPLLCKQHNRKQIQPRDDVIDPVCVYRDFSAKITFIDQDKDKYIMDTNVAYLLLCLRLISHQIADTRKKLHQILGKLI